MGISHARTRSRGSEGKYQVYMCLSCHFTCALILHSLGALGWTAILDGVISC